MSKRQRHIRIASVATMIAAWALVALCAGSDHIMPGPLTTLKSAFRILCDKGFLAVVGSTVARGLLGFGIAALLGVALGIAAGLKEGVAAFVAPWVVVARSIPVVAFILLALIWFKSGSVPVFVGFLTMFPIIYTNVVEGMRQVDGKLVGMARFYRVKTRQVVRHVFVPSIAPFAFSGMSTALGIGWRAIVIGEVLSLPRYGIGSKMQAAKTFLNVDELIAWTIVAVVVSFVFERLTRLAERRVTKWKMT